MKELMEKYQLERKIRAESPWYVRIPLNIGDFLWYRCILRINEFPHNVKWAFQRMFRGYSDSDICNLNSFILNKTYRPLKKFIKNYEESGMSLPTEFATDPGAWTLVLKKIEYSFDDMWNSEHDFNYGSKRLSPEDLDEHNKKVEEGLVLFGKYFRGLWD